MARAHSRAFTLIELLVITAIIGLLASLVLISVNKARAKAKTVKVIGDFQQIEKAFYLWLDEANRNEWWPDNYWISLGIPAQPSLDLLISQTNLGHYLTVAPRFENKSFYYDNDNDTFDVGGDGCDVLYDKGVNLIVEAKPDIAVTVDAMIDGGSGPYCGKVLWDTNQLVYKISKDYRLSYSEAFQGMEGLPDEKACFQDNDCVLVDTSCCDCSSGGQKTCINWQYLTEWNENLPCPSWCFAEFLCDTNPTDCACVNNICTGI